MTVYLNNSIPTIKLSYSFPVPPDERYSIVSSVSAFSLVKRIWDKDLIGLKEQFKVICLDNSNVVLGVYDLSEGGITGTTVDNRLLFVTLLNTRSSRFLVCHNHPSGKREPSNNDIEITKKIKQAGKLLDLELLDHIIITPDDTYYSFADEGML